MIFFLSRKLLLLPIYFNAHDNHPQKLRAWCHDNQQNVTQHNDVQHIMGSFVTLSMNDTQHNVLLNVTFVIVMLNALMMSIAFLNLIPNVLMLSNIFVIVMLYINRLSGIMLNVVMLSVVAPRAAYLGLHYKASNNRN
jgi:hypothetical protein